MHNIERFYLRRHKSIAYLSKHCLPTQSSEVEDLYHEALIIADRRKNTDPTRDDGLCLFSGYTTSLRSGHYSDWHYKKEFLSIDDDNFLQFDKDDSKYEPQKIFDFNSNLEGIATSFALLMIFCPHIRIPAYIALVFFFGDYKNMSHIGESCELSRERIRQLRNSGLSSVKYLVQNLYGKSTDFDFLGMPIDRYEYFESLKDMPEHLSFFSFYGDRQEDFSTAFYKHLKVLSVLFRNFNHDFCFEEHTVYKGVIMEEAAAVSKDIFICLDPSPLNIYYHDKVEVLELGWLRELFAKFVKDDKGWYDELSDLDDDEKTYYSTVPEIIDNVVMDYISENFEIEEFKLMEATLHEKFLRFFKS